MRLNFQYLCVAPFTTLRRVTDASDLGCVMTSGVIGFASLLRFRLSVLRPVLQVVQI